MTSSAAMSIEFLHFQNPPFLGDIHCNFCLNLHINHGDMKENVSGCFFLNTVYILQCNNVITLPGLNNRSVSASHHTSALCSKKRKPPNFWQ